MDKLFLMNSKKTAPLLTSNLKVELTAYTKGLSRINAMKSKETNQTSWAHLTLCVGMPCQSYTISSINLLDLDKSYIHSTLKFSSLVNSKRWRVWIGFLSLQESKNISPFSKCVDHLLVLGNVYVLVFKCQNHTLLGSTIGSKFWLYSYLVKDISPNEQDLLFLDAVQNRVLQIIFQT